MGKVYVPHGDSAADTATLLLAQAENDGLEPGVVATTDGGFVVDEDLAKSAGVDYVNADSSDAAARQAAVDALEDEPEDEPEPAKKAAKKAAKKTAKKTAKKS